MRGSRFSGAVALLMWVLFGEIPALVAGVELRVVAHLYDASHPDAVWCEGSSVKVRAGGDVWTRDGRGFVPAPDVVWPAGLDDTRAGSARSLMRRTPLKDRWMRSEGLRAQAVRGACAVSGRELCWYGVAARGLTVSAGGGLRDIWPDATVLDADVDADARVWAVTPSGLMSGSLDGAQPALTTTGLPAFPPGNALDGAFVHQDALHVFGPRGLHRSTVATSPGAVDFTSLIETPVSAAAPTPNGFAALSGGRLWVWPAGAPQPDAMADAWGVAATSEGRIYVAKAAELWSTGAGRPAPVLEVELPAPPRALCGAGDTLAIALAGPGGGVLTGTANGDGVGGKMAMTRHELDASCFLWRPGGMLLAGAPDGLMSIEGPRVHRFLHAPGLAVTAIAVVRDTVVLATSAGLAALDGPVVVARTALGTGGPQARVTALVSFAGDLWATTAGNGLYRVRLTGAGSPAR